MSDVSENNPELRSQGEQNAETELKGWLHKRSKGLLGVACKWEKLWFHLKGTDLFYGENEQSSVKKIELSGAQIIESDMDNKTFAFGVKPKDSKRTFYLHAETEEQQQEWMQAICVAKLTKTGQAGACSVQ